MFAKFTPDMKKTHIILVPTMIEPHFDFMVAAIKLNGYNAEVLTNDSANIVEEGLKNVHNDMCYPALLVIGQFIDALKSGRYDTDKVALLISQTGGGCRASNYIYLLRKALENSGFEHVPVISLNFSSLDENAFVLSKISFIKIICSVFYGDLIMCLYNQCISYEKEKGQSARAYEICVKKMVDKIDKFDYLRLNKNYIEIIEEFKKVKRLKVKKIKVGIVGEIYMKYSPLGNNNLEKYLVDEGAEVVNTGLMDFILTCVYDVIYNKEIYGKSSNLEYNISKLFAKFLEKKQKNMINTIKKYSDFTPPCDFETIKKAVDGYISHGVSMGEGWLLTAEMIEFVKSGVNNIICAQPFGCLPNHIIAKGMIRKIKDNFPHANIVSVDYDPGASKINQENRIKLMLATAKQELEK